jgi:hypothetical protein
LHFNQNNWWTKMFVSLHKWLGFLLIRQSEQMDDNLFHHSCLPDILI